jgi:diguanylate cyclase (GGDEF)-like protein
MRSTALELGVCPAVYFKYIPNRRVLIAAKGENLHDVDLKGLGVNFNEIGRPFRASDLHDPQSLPEIVSLIREVFGKEDFFALPVEVLGEIQGLIFFLVPPPIGETAARMRDAHIVLEKGLSLIEAEKRLHVLSVKDPGTDLTNRATFIAKITEEVSRSRRTNSPLSLILIAVDQYGGLVSQCGTEEAQIVLRMMARIFEKHSRVNDLIGRTASDEFGLLLPHTGRKGAMIKAERLRRIIETADFSRVVAAFPQFTVSLGISEYPSVVRDAEELLQSADEALMQVRQAGNKACAASAPDGFIADFNVPETGL